MKNSRGLKEVIQLLNDNKISVEIRSHTDSKGSSKYNSALSEKRAKAVYEYLIKNNVNKYRLRYKGYGETMLINKCKDGVRCSDSEHAKNRRTDFKVIGLR
ncbi:MAG: OmpA family protein [Saprospiraceae bacterium]|nr:OmpA family protein [Saprospiraceae bacterium]